MTGRERRLAPSLYRLLLQVAGPRDLRGRDVDDMVQVFSEIHRDAGRRGVGAVFGVWWRALTQTIGGGWRDRFGRGGRRRRLNSSGKRSRMLILDHLAQDIRFAIRSFIRNPGFSLTAVVIIALGIGATTAIFSVVDGIVLRKLPYPDQDRLVYFDQGSHTVPEYKEWLERITTFDEIVAIWPAQRTLLGAGSPQQVVLGQATANTFPVFGALPALGRLLTLDDVQTNAPVVVLSYDFWVRQFGSDPSVLGRSIQLDARSYEIVGVAAAGFALPARLRAVNVAVWSPLDVTRADLDRRGFYMLRVAGRLREDATLESARAQMAVWEEAAAEAYPSYNIARDGSIRRVPLLELQSAESALVRGTLFMLFGAVGLMLLIACANVANLLLARGADRGKEIAVRVALGGGRIRIGMQLLTESVVLALVGSAAGIGVARLGIGAFALLAPSNTPRIHEIGMDLRVVAFALAAALTTGVIFGLAPALYAARTDVNESLKEASGKSSAGRGRLRTKGALVVGEIALALILLVGAGLLFNSFVRLKSVDPGFDPENVLIVPLTFASWADIDPGGEGPRRMQALRDIMDRVRALPGVASVAAGAVVPFTENGRCCMMGSAKTNSREDSTRVVRHPIPPGFFETLRIPIVAGRDLTWADANASDNPVIITRTHAERFFGDENPIGQTFLMGRTDRSYTVIGVVGDPKFWSLSRDVDLDVFFAHSTAIADGFTFMHLAVRTAGPIEGLRDALRTAVWSVDPDMPIPQVASLTVNISETMTSERFLSTLLIVFAAFAIALAAVGIYGTMLYAVSQQSHEFGIRLALGADASRIVGRVLRRGALLTGIGLVLGLAGAVALSRVLESLVFGITAQDIPTYGAVTLLLGLVAIVACYVPARKASRLDPMVMLRSE